MDDPFISVLVYRMIFKCLAYTVYVGIVLLLILTAYWIVKHFFHTEIKIRFKRILLILVAFMIVCYAIFCIPILLDICTHSYVYAENVVLIPHAETKGLRTASSFETGYIQLICPDGSNIILRNPDIDETFYQKYADQEIEAPLVIYAQRSRQLLYPDYASYIE